MNALLLAAPEQAMTWMTFVPFILILVVSYFMLIRPQKKRDQQMKDMRSKIEVGDEIITAGGIIGRVVSFKDETVVIETGTDRSKIRIARWAIQMNTTAQAQAQAQTAAAKETGDK
ncbi:MAG: preprotein translocase subunit YajC [Oscillospiraceae bacterium]